MCNEKHSIFGFGLHLFPVVAKNWHVIVIFVCGSYFFIGTGMSVAVVSLILSHVPDLFHLQVR